MIFIILTLVSHVNINFGVLYVYQSLNETCTPTTIPTIPGRHRQKSTEWGSFKPLCFSCYRTWIMFHKKERGMLPNALAIMSIWNSRFACWDASFWIVLLHHECFLLSIQLTNSWLMRWMNTALRLPSDKAATRLLISDYEVNFRLCLAPAQWSELPIMFKRLAASNTYPFGS